MRGVVRMVTRLGDGVKRKSYQKSTICLMRLGVRSLNIDRYGGVGGHVWDMRVRMRA